MKTILVTGGAGYIGANIVKLLIDKKYKVIILDNLSTGKKSLINKSALFYKADLRNISQVRGVFKANKIDTVIHLGGLSIVSESNKNPNSYYDNNILGSLILLKVMEENKCNKIIFSSSAAVYGAPKYTPVDEWNQKIPLSVYGETKGIIEEILRLKREKFVLKWIALRYFNAGGASDCGKYGELHTPETHLIPIILQSAISGADINIFGDNYKTKDGTCIRDYVHVVDLANAHIKGIKYLDLLDCISMPINLGSKEGYTVQEIIKKCAEVTNTKFKINIVARRGGDPDVLIANTFRAKKVLKWEPTKHLEDIIASSWKFMHTNKYINNTK